MKIIFFYILILKGEQLGLHLNVSNEENSKVIVARISPKSAALRASDPKGNICPIMLDDEILEINGVELNVIFNLNHA